MQLHPHFALENAPYIGNKPKKNTPLKAKQKAQEIRRSPPDMYGNPVNYGDIPPYQLVQCIISLNKKPGKNSQRFCQRWPVWQLLGRLTSLPGGEGLMPPKWKKQGSPWLVACLEGCIRDNIFSNTWGLYIYFI